MICNSSFYMQCLICYITVSNKLQNNIFFYLFPQTDSDCDYANYYVTNYVCEIGEKFPETKIFRRATYIFATIYLCYLKKLNKRSLNFLLCISLIEYICHIYITGKYLNGIQQCENKYKM